MNKPKDAKEKAIERIKQGIEIEYLNDKYSPFAVIEEAIDIAISEATHDCEEKIKQLKKEDKTITGLLLQYDKDVKRLQKENTELKQGLYALEKKYAQLKDNKIKARDK